MRAGLCSVQQALTIEATSIVKQAVTLARRRGHTQVTPLHVASAMLASSASLLRKACLQSHSHPLQCKALELCFNVALNRLPASTSSPLLGPHYPLPALSNALVAAFKRAQAHQRRGSVENQQQPILALKIELEQLVISILDDPSVSRVMREAGFSSTQVKNKVEQVVPLEIVNSQSPKNTKPRTEIAQIYQPFSYYATTHNKPSHHQVMNYHNEDDDDVNTILSTLVNKRRNTVITGESLSSIELLVRGVMERFEKGDGNLRNLQFISLPLSSLRNLSKEEIEEKLMELRSLVKGYMGNNGNKGIVLYLGDLKWVSDIWSSSCVTNHQKMISYYTTPVEYIIMEVKRLLTPSRIEENGRIWLMGIATFHTYSACKIGHPSLETVLDLHPISLPLDNLSLSLNLDSNSQSRFENKMTKDWMARDQIGVEKHLTRTKSFFGVQTQSSIPRNIDEYASSNNIPMSTSSSLPSWLKQYKEEESNRMSTINDEECVNVMDISEKWSSVHKHHRNLNAAEKVLNLLASSSSSPTSPDSVSSHDRNPTAATNLSWPIIFETKLSPKEHQFWVSEISDDDNEREDFESTNPAAKPDLLSNPNSSPNSASSSEAIEEDNNDDDRMFMELNAENMNILRNALEKKVSDEGPDKQAMIEEIARNVLQCRSGMRVPINKFERRDRVKEETWFAFLGSDFEAKEKIGKELARVIFGSQTKFVQVRDISTDKKRKRDELNRSYLNRFAEALNENPHRVFVLEDFEEIDDWSQKGMKQAIKTGSTKLPCGEHVPLKDAIVIFSGENFRSVSRVTSSPRNQKNIEKDDEKIKFVSLDLNISIHNGVQTMEDDDDDEDEDHNGQCVLEYVDAKFLFENNEDIVT